MAALPPPMITWAMSADGWPIYGEPDTTGHQERLQIDGVQTVDLAGRVYPVMLKGFLWIVLRLPQRFLSQALQLVNETS